MNREIKFRGKRVDNGEWVYGSLVNNLWVNNKTGDVCEIIPAHDTNDCWEDYASEGIYEVIPETVGQFVGVIDILGKQCYEKDIVTIEQSTIGRGSRTKYKKFNTVITFDNGSFDAPFPKDYGEYRFRRGLWFHNFEIIGNIYENPELMKHGITIQNP